MRRRGSAYIYVLLMIIAITIVGMAVSDASMNFILTQRRRENAMRADVYMTGATEAFDADRLVTRVEFPNTRNVTVDGITCTVVAEDFPQAPGTIKVKASCNFRDRLYEKVTYIAKERFSAFQYAIAATKVDTGNTISTGLLGAGGNVYGQDIQMRSLLNTINGDVDSPVQTVRGIVTGGVYTKQGTIMFPKVSTGDYVSNATTTLSGDQTINGYTFAAVAAGAPYPLVVVTGNLTIKGAISGIGTFYVKGNITVNGAITYANASSRVAFLGDADINIGGFNVVGYMYAEDDINISGLLGNVTSGGLMARDEMVFGRAITVTHDSAVTDDLNEGVRMKLPGYWP